MTDSALSFTEMNLLDFRRREKMAIYERELKLLNQTKSIKNLVVLKRTVDSKSWWELMVFVNDQEEGLTVLTARNTDRRWAKLDSLHTFIADTCSNVDSFVVEIHDRAEQFQPTTRSNRSHET